MATDSQVPFRALLPCCASLPLHQAQNAAFGLEGNGMVVARPRAHHWRTKSKRPWALGSVTSKSWPTSGRPGIMLAHPPAQEASGRGRFLCRLAAALAAVNLISFIISFIIIIINLAVLVHQASSTAAGGVAVSASAAVGAAGGLRGIRGATTADNNTELAIHAAAEELIREMMRVNSLAQPDVEEILASATPDLTAAFAATPARTRVGLHAVLFGMQEASVDGSPKRCIRMLMRAYSARPQRNISHVYLRGATGLRGSVPGGGGGSGSGRTGVGVGGGDGGRSALDAVLRRRVLLVGTTGDYPPFTLRCTPTTHPPRPQRPPPPPLGPALGPRPPPLPPRSPTLCDAAHTWPGAHPVMGPEGQFWAGSDVEMAHALALDLGVEVAIVRTNWGTLMEDMVQKTLFDVAVGGITDTLARRKHVAFSDATAFSGKTILLPCALLNESGALHPKVMADLYHGLPTALNASDLVIAVNAGGTNYQFVHKYAPAAIKLVVAQGAQPEALLRGDAHVVVTDSVEAELMSAWYPSQVLF